MTLCKMEKLVRDKIPDIIEKQGRTCSVRVADDEDYLRSLIAKLDEEVSEFKEAHDPAELVDILEVIHALALHKGISVDELERNRSAKARNRGGFEKKFILKL